MSTLLGIGALILGAIAATWGHRRRSYHELVAGTPTSRVLDVDEPGTVELEGTVQPTSDGPRSLEAPLTGERCLVAGWEIEEWDEGGKRSSWDRVAQGYDSVPFLLDDGTAEIRVEVGRNASSAGLFEGDLSFGDLRHSVKVDDVTVDFDRLPTRQQLAPSDETPDAIERFEQNTPGVSEQSGSLANVIDMGTAHGERKYHEASIKPGDDVYVLGTVQPSDGGDAHPDRRLRPEDAVVTTGDDPFVVSTRSESELRENTSGGTVTMLAGLALAAAGVLVLTVPGLL